MTSLINRENSPQRKVRPTADVYETDDSFQIHLDVPGVKNDDVEMELNKDALQITASRTLGGETLRYVRGFTVPEGVDRDNVSARLESGVLQITLPKHAEVRPRQIKVKAA